jgi:hypothetical protein
MSTQNPITILFLSEECFLMAVDGADFFRRLQTKSQMNDQTKLALFDALLAYLIQSSTAMDGTIKALSTGALVSPHILNEAFDSAKVLLSKVIHHSLNLDCISFVL